MTALVVLNFVLANVWLHRGLNVRADLTEGSDYTISQATRDLVAQLQEPLLIRGYFSARTHPVLGARVPRIRDTIREIESISGGRVRAELWIPGRSPISRRKPTALRHPADPFRPKIATRPRWSTRYFDLLLQYGDKHEVLRFTDLIEIQRGRTGPTSGCGTSSTTSHGASRRCCTGSGHRRPVRRHRSTR